MYLQQLQFIELKFFLEIFNMDRGNYVSQKFNLAQNQLFSVFRTQSQKSSKVRETLLLILSLWNEKVETAYL